MKEEKFKIALILVYFGRLPNYFHFWLSSAAKNSTVDFLLITDCTDIVIPGNNIKVIKSTLVVVNKLANQVFRMKCCMPSPYKLCDYKPAYGLIFKKYLKDYDFWGHCDPDIVWGDIRAFVTDEILENYDKIYNLGHLTLYRNTKENNSKLKKLCTGVDYTYYEAFHMQCNVAFDEKSAIIPWSNNGLWKQYDDKSIIADIWPDTVRYRTWYTIVSDYNHIYEYNNGKILGWFVNEDNLQCKEFLYIHLQGRKMQCETNNTTHFLIVENRFINYRRIQKEYIHECSKDLSKIYMSHPVINEMLAPLWIRYLRKCRRLVFFHILKIR